MNRLIFTYNKLKRQDNESAVEKWVLRFVAGKITKPEKIKLLKSNDIIYLTIYHKNDIVEQMELLNDNPLNYNFLCFETLEEAINEYNNRNIFKIKSLLNNIDKLNKQINDIEKELIGEDLISLKLNGKI